ncbi:MAG: hypothetical protein ACLTAY_10855 [Thomasclavelia ramosa]
MLQMPFLGAAIALLLNLATAKIFGYDFIDYLKINIDFNSCFSQFLLSLNLYVQKCHKD